MNRALIFWIVLGFAQSCFGLSSHLSIGTDFSTQNIRNEIMYGKELTMDLYGCDVNLFNRRDLKKYLVELCGKIGMVREDLHFWDYLGVPKDEIPYDKPHLVGTSVVQFITTSNITIHTLDMIAECYINLFTCKDFDHYAAQSFTRDFFKAGRIHYEIRKRGIFSEIGKDGPELHYSTIVSKGLEEPTCLNCQSHLKCSGPTDGDNLCNRYKRKEKKDGS